MVIKVNEIFYEETTLINNPKSAKFKYNLINTLSIISYCFIFIWIFVYLNSFGHVNVIIDIIVFIIPTVIFVLIGLFIGRLKNRFYQEYDYTIVSDCVRIAKVIKGVKRKFLLEFNSYHIEKLGLYGSETFYKYQQMPGVKIQILTPNEFPAKDKEFYYIVVNINSEKTILIFECTDVLIKNILKFAKKTVLEKE